MPVAPIGDGIADDTGAVMDYIAADMQLPIGTFRITQKIDLLNTQSGFSRGYTLRGTHPMGSVIVGDYDDLNPTGGMVDIAPDAISKYTQFTTIKNLTLRPAEGRTIRNGIALTGAWWVKIENNIIEQFGNHGIITPFRTDLHPTISDYYQDYAVKLEGNIIRHNGANGVEFTSGQSPGLFLARHNTIHGNGSVGFRTTTGQCIINQNNIFENGVGGLHIDTREGPAMVAEVTQNEIQNNKYWGVNMYRSRNLLFARNRLLSLANGNLQPVGVSFGLGNSGYEIHSLIAEQNLFRSDITSGGYAFVTDASAFSASFPSYFRANRFDVPAGHLTYAGPFTGASILS